MSECMRAIAERVFFSPPISEICWLKLLRESITFTEQEIKLYELFFSGPFFSSQWFASLSLIIDNSPTPSCLGFYLRGDK